MFVVIRRRWRWQGRLLCSAFPRACWSRDGRLDQTLSGVLVQERFYVPAACRVHDDHLDDLLALDERIRGDVNGGAGGGARSRARHDGQLRLGSGRSRRSADLVRSEPVVN